MTLDEAIVLINNIEYKYLCRGLMFSEWYTFKPSSLKILKEVQKKVPNLKIYDGKFRLIRKI